MRARHAEPSASCVNPADVPYTVNDLMVLHGFSRATIIRIYQNEPDVQILQSPRTHQRKIGRRYPHAARAETRVRASAPQNAGQVSP